MENRRVPVRSKCSLNTHNVFAASLQNHPDEGEGEEVMFLGHSGGQLRTPQSQCPTV